MEDFFAPILDADSKTSYNVLWLWTHLIKDNDAKLWLKSQYDTLVSLLIEEKHQGKCRLLLSLIYQISPVTNTRSDLIDFCIEHINAPYEIAVRAFSINLLTILIGQYPDLIGEVEYALKLLDNGEIPAAVATARRKLVRQLQKVRKKL